MSKQTTDLTMWGVKFIVDYYYDKGEPQVMYYADGSGHPGSPPSVELDGIYVEGSEQELYECLQDSLTEQIEHKILESYE
jgi:hypothetical protein